MSSAGVKKPKVAPFTELSPWKRCGVFGLRVSHFFLARSGIFVAIFLLCLLSERAYQEVKPPIPAWIVYLHASLAFFNSEAAVYMITSTGMSTRILPTLSVIIASIFYSHLAYLFLVEQNFGYPPWLRVRVALRLLGLAGGSLRLLATGDFEPDRILDKIGAGLSGFICALMGLLSLPLNTVAHVSGSARQQEMNSLLYFLTLGGITHWIIGLTFCLAFVAYSFPVLVILPPGQAQTPLIVRLVSWADKLACVGWGLTLLCKDINWSYWQGQKIEYWLQNTLILAEVVTIASIAIGASLPWLARVSKPHGEKQKQNDKKDN